MGIYAEVADPRYRYLKKFQSDRLFATFADFAARPEYQAACAFFFTRLYSTDDTSERDQAFLRIYSIAQKLVPARVLDTMTRLIELQNLTVALDQELMKVLVEKLGAPVEFTMAAYEEAYRLANDYPRRVRQIELLEFTMRHIHSISHTRGIWLVLKALQTATAVIGDTRMADFLMAGYQAFADLESIEPLVEAMLSRELGRLDRIYRKADGTAKKAMNGKGIPRAS